MSKSDSGSSAVTWVLFVAFGLGLAWLTGRLSPHMVDDSRSYLQYEFGSLDQICRSIRMPGYPLLLLVLEKTLGNVAVPAVQVAIHATAAWLLLRELLQWGMRPAAALPAAVAVGIGCTPMDHIHTISTDALAASLGVITTVSLLRWVRLEGSAKSSIPVVVAIVLVVFIRPAYLFLIPWVVIAGGLLRQLKGSDWKSAFRASLTLALIPLVPLICWMTMRLAVAGDFGILPFGHHNLAGVLVQLVSDEELNEIGSDLSGAIIEAKQSHDQQVGLAPGDPGATMTIESRWHPMTWSVVYPAAVQVTSKDNIESHRVIADLNKSILRRYPTRYAKWLVKATRRGAWGIAADIVMHPVFLSAICVMVVLMIWRAVSGKPGSLTLVTSPSWRALTIVTWTYVIAKVGFVILTSPPIGRFSDAAAIFVPAWLAATFFSLIADQAP